MYLPRLLGGPLRRILEQFPSVLITGPRQSGKTTFLLEELGQDADYVSFDDPLERSFALSDPNGFLNRFERRRVILDEIQYVPELLPYLKLRIDRDRRGGENRGNGRWLLTGSQQFQLMANVSESLAGRIALLELPPFSLLEASEERRGGLRQIIWNGAYPDPALYPEKRDPWLSSYLRTYVERDVRQLSNIQDLRSFETLVALCAARHAQELNMAALARDSGVSQPTIKTWLGVLEASYLALLVRPYLENFGKRIVRSPKLYYLDSALVCALTRQPSADAAVAGSMGGSLFEGFVVSEAFKVFLLCGQPADLYFWRSQDGLEVDLLIRVGPRLYPVEIKLTATPSPGHLRPLNRFKALAGPVAAATGILVCRVPQTRPLPSNNLALPWNEFPAWLTEKLAPGSVESRRPGP